MNHLGWGPILLLGWAGCTVDPVYIDKVPTPRRADHVFLMELEADNAAWTDFAFLAAIPASSHLNGGRPAVLAVEDAQALPPATTDLLQRMAATDAYVLNQTATLESVEQVHTLNAVDASALSLQLTAHWSQSTYLVLADGVDYESAVLASSLAARLNAPLLFTETLPSGARETVENELSVLHTVWVDLGSKSALAPQVSTEIRHVDDALQWLANSAGGPVSYVALTNVNDRNAGRAQKASLVAPMIAARREGLVVPVALEMPRSTVDQGALPEAAQILHERYAVMGHVPEYLALVGAHDALPHIRGATIFGDSPAGDPVTDLPYGQVDDDVFLDIALGRIVGDHIFESSALATRTTTYEQLADGHWENRFIETGLWGYDETRALFTNVGFEEPDHPTEQDIAGMGNIEAAAILHKDHSNCMILGHAFDLNTEVLLAPSIVTSSGCSVAGMDQISTPQRSIGDHMLGSGAVAFMGATRNAIAENTYLHVAFWNQVLEGQSIGFGYRAAINELMVHWLDAFESPSIRYSIDIQLLYGDPALTFSAPAPPITAPASVQLTDNTVTVTGPESWTLVQYADEQLDEWNYEEDLFMYVAPGISPRTYWSGQHDAEDLYLSVAVPVVGPFTGIRQEASYEDPLGWRGAAYVEDLLDGTQQVRWTVRMLDYDMANGDIHDQIEQVQYTLER